jgi:hypothetical protein
MHIAEEIIATQMRLSVNHLTAAILLHQATNDISTSSWSTSQAGSSGSGVPSTIETAWMILNCAGA